MSFKPITAQWQDQPNDLPLFKDKKGVWHVTGFAEARAIMLGDVRQAGFHSETMAKLPNRLTKPVLFQDGDEHREQRRLTSRFFTPTAIQQRYRPLMERVADQIITEELRQPGKADLNHLSSKMATAVIAEVVGLTASPLAELTARMDGILNLNLDIGLDLRRLPRLLELNRLMRDFMNKDVHPAVEARRAAPQEDVISHLIAQGRSDEEILIECITYGAAGMVTTQEFICVAAFHFLENPEVRQQYVDSSPEERITILNEVLRLEPVVGRLSRRAASELEIESRGQLTCIPAGALIELHIFEINRDAAAVGANPLDFDPLRKTERGVTQSAMSFGSGAHRCIGEHLALAESDIFLTRLMAVPDLRVVKPPSLERSSLTQSYKLREFLVACN